MKWASLPMGWAENPHWISAKLPSLCCCAFCSTVLFSSVALCNTCRNDLPWQESGCRRCGLPVNSSQESPGSVECLPCTLNPPPFYACHTLFEYKSPVRELLARFKFGGNLSDGALFGRLLAEKFQQQYHQEFGPQLLVPVPLHKNRLRQRGFNQAVELARFIARRSGVKISKADFVRLRDTTAQHSLGASDRKKNLANAFAAGKPLTAPLPDHVAIIDDVVTTGSTAGVLAELMLRNGAKQIDVWAVARAA